MTHLDFNQTCTNALLFGFANVEVTKLKFMSCLKCITKNNNTTTTNANDVTATTIAAAKCTTDTPTSLFEIRHFTRKDYDFLCAGHATLGN